MLGLLAQVQLDERLARGARRVITLIEGEERWRMQTSEWLAWV